MRNSFYILNEVERPDEVHIVQVINDDGVCRYIHSDLLDWGELQLRESSTDVLDFGFTIEEKSGVAVFKKTGESKACYGDGKIRDWQGKNSFTLALYNHTEQEKPSNILEISDTSVGYVAVFTGITGSDEKAEEEVAYGICGDTKRERELYAMGVWGVDYDNTEISHH